MENAGEGKIGVFIRSEWRSRQSWNRRDGRRPPAYRSILRSFSILHSQFFISNRLRPLQIPSKCCTLDVPPNRRDTMKILHTTPAQDGFYMPAEFAPHEDCLMIWSERADS